MASLVSNETTPTLIEDPDVPQNAIATIAKTTTTSTATSKTTVNVEEEKKDGKLNEESNTTELNQKMPFMSLKRQEQFRKSSINRINMMRKNLKGSKRRAWEKYGSLVGFKERTQNMEKNVEKLKEKCGIVEDDLEDISPFVHTPVTPDPDVPCVAMVDGKLTRLEKDGNSSDIEDDEAFLSGEQIRKLAEFKRKRAERMAMVAEAALEDEEDIDGDLEVLANDFENCYNDMLNILENEDGFDEEYGLNREGFIIDSTSCGEKDGNFHTEYPLNPSEKNDDFHILEDDEEWRELFETYQEIVGRASRYDGVLNALWKKEIEGRASR